MKFLTSSTLATDGFLVSFFRAWKRPRSSSTATIFGWNSSMAAFTSSTLWADTWAVPTIRISDNADTAIPGRREGGGDIAKGKQMLGEVLKVRKARILFTPRIVKAELKRPQEPPNHVPSFTPFKGRRKLNIC